MCNGSLKVPGLTQGDLEECDKARLKGLSAGELYKSLIPIFFNLYFYSKTGLCLHAEIYVL